jgi:hypothetical protein
MKISNGIALAAAVSVSSAAIAEIDLAWTGNGPFQVVDWSYNASASWDGPSNPNKSQGILGLYTFNDGEYEGYCWELDAPVSQSPTAYEITEFSALDGETQARFTFLASLYDQWYEEVKAVASTDFESGYRMGAALAFLTNEIMEENYDFIPGTWILEDVQLQSSNATGAIQFDEFSTEVQGYYDTMLASLDFGTEAMIDGLVIYESVDGFQSFVGYVPAPSALALLGLSGLAGRRRRNG